jgi:hypothetical protein
MPPRQRFGISVRLFAAWLVLQSVPYFTTISAAYDRTPGDSMIGYLTVVGYAYLGVAAILWLFPLAIPGELVPDDQSACVLTFGAQNLAWVGCALIDLWSVPELIEHAWLSVERQGSLAWALSGQGIAAAAIQLALGIILVVKSKTFAAFVVPSTRNEAGA